MQEEIWDKLYEHLTWKKETINLPKVMGKKKILELGVGNGKTLISILKQGPIKVYAIDFSAKAIEKSERRFGSKIELIRADATKLPFENESFDVVVAYYILNNSMKKDREKIAREIYRVLKKKGLCLFEDFSVNDFRNTGKNKEKNTIIKQNGLICHFFEEKEVRSLFREFSRIKTKILRYNPIRNSELKRELVKGIIVR